jgi:putative hydrolase of the HAD superfamily
MIRGIVFDLFDTLVDLHHDRLSAVEVDGRRVPPTTLRVFEHVAGCLGSSFSLSLGEFGALQREVDGALRVETLDEGRELATQQRFEALLERLGIERAGLAQECTAIYMGLLRDVVTVPDHHEAILASLAVDHRLGLCSNFSHGGTARALLSEARFDTHLDTIVISEEVGIRKPRAPIFEAVCTAMELAPEEILHVGDSLSADVAGAAAAGMRTVWLTRRIASPEAELERYEGPSPDFALEDLLDLPVLTARLGVSR